MHLLITSAKDVTSDLICERISSSVIRVNLELWKEYFIQINDDQFVVADNFGRIVTANTLGNIIWRKPVSDISTEDGEYWYGFHEFKYAILSIMAEVRRKTPFKIPIDPHINKTIDKFYQLRIASKYLNVPAWHYTTKPSSRDWGKGQWITKSVTGNPIAGTGTPAHVIFTVEVNPYLLDDNWTWFVQEKVDFEYDLTIVYVNGNQFGYVLNRSLFQGLDWRKSIGSSETNNGWESVKIPTELSENVSSFMNELGLKFGRLDLLAKDKSLQETKFLEVNPNGQWAWLDNLNNNGLFDSVINFITS